MSEKRNAQPRILVVLPESQRVRELVFYLEQQAFEVLYANEAPSAYDILDAEAVDVVICALREKRILAAGLDVYEDEPRLATGLEDLDNAFLLPHLGSATVDDRHRMMEIAVDNVIAALRGETPPHCIS